MDTKEKKKGKLKKTAAVSAVALLTAASVTTASLFDTPASMLSDDGGAATSYSVGVDGADDDDAGMEQDESGETRRRGGARAVLRTRILQLPLAVRLLAVLPLWALGSLILAAAGSAFALLSPVLGRAAGFALLLALLLGAFLLAAKAVFPDLPVKKILNRRSIVGLLLGAAALSAADAVLIAVWEDYGQIRDIVLSVGFFAALSAALIPFALRQQKRRLTAAGQQEKAPERLTFTDGASTYTVRVPKAGV